MTVRELIAQLIEYDNQNAEVKIVYLPEGLAAIEYVIPVDTYASVVDGKFFIAIEVEDPEEE